jgi:uncharacterized membrane protein YfcA
MAPGDMSGAQPIKKAAGARPSFFVSRPWRRIVDASGLSVLEFSLLLGLGSLLAGLLGALSGLGGGVVIVPLLTLALGVDIRYAIGASLMAVIATSSGAAAAYVREGYTNIRLGMLLEIATTTGGLSGAVVASRLDANVIAVIFGAVLLFSAAFSLRSARDRRQNQTPDPLATRLKLNGTFPGPAGEESYLVRGVPAGFGLMYVAGLLSGLLGIGSGAVKVLAMDRAMRIPFKVSTTTSNFMIGVTAAASAGVYLHRGYVEPGLSMPIVLGVVGGAMLGARVLVRGKASALRVVFALLVTALGIQMIVSGWRGTL